MGIWFGLQRHFLLNGEFDIISDDKFSKWNEIFEATIIVELKRQGLAKLITLGTDNERDDDDELEVVEAAWTLLRMLNSSSMCCQELENLLFTVQRWMWVNLCIPPNFTFLKWIYF